MNGAGQADRPSNPGQPGIESSVPGVFACGGVRLSPVKRVAAAVGEGSMSIAFVRKYLQRDTRRVLAGTKDEHGQRKIICV